jgi:glycosyltransferase involved in cell wall biosynthesis
VRILKVTQAYYPFQERGGPAVKIRSIARLLVRLGNNVTVLTADLGFRPANINAAGISRTERGWRAELDGVEAVYLRTMFHYRSLTVNPGIVDFCRERLRDFELVHIYGLYDVLGPAVASFCRRFMIPYFVEPLGMTRPIDRGFLLKKLWWRMFWGYLPGASRIVATSELERSELLEDHFEANRVLLRYNGIDLKEFRQLPAQGSFRKKAGLAEDEKFVLFLGRIIPRKGADLLIEALAQIGCEKLKLVLAGPEGEPGYVASLRAKARAAGVERRVLFVGPLYGEEKNAALADAWIFALPSRYENFGNTAAEAIACGTPAIVSERCGIAPLIRQAAGLVVSYDAESLARSLGALLNDDALYQQLKAGCRSVAEGISWDHLVREMQDSYECARDHFLRRSPV